MTPPSFFLIHMKTMASFCFQEATLSAVVITCYMMLSDAVENYMEHQKPLPLWKKYLLSWSIMFVSSFVSITFILFLFGHDCHHPSSKKKNNKTMKYNK